jgi:hypothetical protein
MTVYGPVRHPKKYYMDLRSFGPYTIFFVTDRSIYCHMTLSAMNYLLYIYHQYISVKILQWVRIRTYSVSGHESIWRNITKPKCNLNIQINDGSIENNSEQHIIIESNMSWQDISKLYNSLPLGMKDWYPPIHVKTYNTEWLPWIIY